MKKGFRIVALAILVVFFYFTVMGEKLINEISDNDPKDIKKTMPKGFINKLKRIVELIS